VLVMQMKMAALAMETLQPLLMMMLMMMLLLLMAMMAATVPKIELRPLLLLLQRDSTRGRS
jgi:hypothetical protein